MLHILVLGTQHAATAELASGIPPHGGRSRHLSHRRVAHGFASPPSMFSRLPCSALPPLPPPPHLDSQRDPCERKGTEAQGLA